MALADDASLDAVVDAWGAGPLIVTTSTVGTPRIADRYSDDHDASSRRRLGDQRRRSPVFSPDEEAHRPSVGTKPCARTPTNGGAHTTAAPALPAASAMPAAMAVLSPRARRAVQWVAAVILQRAFRRRRRRLAAARDRTARRAAARRASSLASSSSPGLSSTTDELAEPISLLRSCSSGSSLAGCSSRTLVEARFARCDHSVPLRPSVPLSVADGLGCSGPLGLRVAEYVRPGATEEPYVLVDEIKEGSAAAAIQDLVRATGSGCG